MRYLIYVGGAALVVLAVGSVYRAWRQRQPDPAMEMQRVGHRYMVDASGKRLEHDEELEGRTRKRRAETDSLRARAAGKDAGKQDLDVARMADWKRRA